MTVTITIENNVRYCDEHGLAKLVNEECYCTDKIAGVGPEIYCPNCKGSGEYTRVEHPFTMNLSNRNFHTLWAALGLEAEEDCGSVDARTLRKAMVTTSVEMVERADSEGTGAGGAQWQDMGISLEQGERYWKQLAVLCDAAEAREERIYWC